MDIAGNTFDPSQRLQLIAETIAKTKDNISEHNVCFLLWGWLIAIASFLFFILHAFTAFQLYFLPFPILVAAGIITTVIYYKGKRFSSDTYLSYFLKRLWLVLGIAFIIVVAISVVEQNPPFTYTLLICGTGTLVSGMVMQFKPLNYGGVLFLVCCVLSVFVPDSYKPLLQGAAVCGGYLVPGYLLKYSKK